jgi:guanylate kinase
MKNKGKLFIISGPSGVGKTTIRNEILKTYKNFWYSISMTTRKKRENEQDKIDYYFVTKKEFIKNIKENNFFEYAEVYKDIFYGTPKNKVINKLNKGINVILEIDVEGALNIKKEENDAILIFISPPDIKELKKRLLERQTDDKKVIEERINKAEYEISQRNKYNYIVINNNLETAVKEIKQIIEKELNK